MAKVGGLQVDLDLLTAKFEAGMRRTDANFRRLNAHASRSSRAMQKLTGQFSAFGKAAAAALSVGALTRGFRSAVELGDELGKTADKLGVGVERLQAWTFAGEQSGIAADQFQTALQRLGRRVAEAANGTGEARGALARLGVSATDSAGRIKTLEEILPQIADQMGKVDSAQERMAIAAKLFDSEGVKMVNLLRNGAQGLSDLEQQARAAGIVLDERLVRSAEDTNDRLNIMSRVINAELNRGFLALSPAVLKVAEAFGTASTRAKAFFDRINLANEEAAMDRVAELQDRYHRKLQAGLRRDSLEAKFLRDEIKLAMDAYIEFKKRRLPADPLAPDTPAAAPVLKLPNLGEWKPRVVQPLREVAEASDTASRALDLISAQFEELDEAAARKFAGLDAMPAKLQEQADQWADIKQAVEGFGRSFADTMIQSEGRFRDFANSVVQQLGRIAIARLTDPLFASFGDWIGKTLSSAFPGRAAGGPVTAGQPYVIGERGPELFVPGRSGTVVPNDQVGGGGSVSVAPVYNIDARGASPGTAAALQQVMDRTTERTVALMRDMKRRGRLPEFA